MAVCLHNGWTIFSFLFSAIECLSLKKSFRHLHVFSSTYTRKKNGGINIRIGGFCYSMSGSRWDIICKNRLMLLLCVLNFNFVNSSDVYIIFPRYLTWHRSVRIRGPSLRSDQIPDARNIVRDFKLNPGFQIGVRTFECTACASLWIV